MPDFIPKRIFYAWFGGGAMPIADQVCRQTWKLVMPGFELVELNEKDETFFNFKRELESCKWLKAVYEKKIWAFVSSYARIKALYDHGGVYFDTDVSAIQSFDSLLTNDFFSGFHNQSQIAGGVLGCKANHDFLEDVLKFYNRDIWTQPIYTIIDIITLLLTKRYNISANFLYEYFTNQPVNAKNVVIYPEEYFYPLPYGEVYNDSCLTKNSYCIHWWSGSWKNESNLKWLANKHTQKSI